MMCLGSKARSPMIGLRRQLCPVHRCSRHVGSWWQLYRLSHRCLQGQQRAPVRRTRVKLFVMVAVWRVYIVVVLRNTLIRLVLAHGEVLHTGLPASWLGQLHCACIGWIPQRLLLSTAHWEELCVQWQGCNVYQCVHAGVKLVTLCQWHCTWSSGSCCCLQFTGKGCGCSGKVAMFISACMLA
jgi:hypothetical protein